MKRVITFLLLFSVVIVLYSKEVILNPKATLFKTDYSDLRTTELEFNLDKYQMEEVTKEGISYKKISYPLEGNLYQIGKPDLPVFTRFVAVPNKGKVDIKIEDSEFEKISNILIYPLQNDEKGKSNFVIDEKFYQKDIDFPQKITKLYSPVILRDYRVVAVSFFPFVYNPKTKILKIYKKIKVKITTSSEKGENEKDIIHKKSRFFEEFYNNIIVNYEQIKGRDEYQQPTLLIIYSNNSNLETFVNILADWKRQKGFNVISVSTEETGLSVSSIKGYIQQAYDSWENPPEFVMLVGDANESDEYYIPTGNVDGGAGDQIYTLLEGDDILADVIIGRLSVDTQAKIQTVLQKILRYEKEPYMANTDWYSKILLVGDPSQSGPSTISTNKYIKELILNKYPNDVIEEQYSGNFVNFMTNGFNDGVLYFNYRGYIGMSGFDNNNIESLNNGFMLPYVVDITCATGNFDSGSGEARSETFLFAGTPTNPKGGIAAIGTATSSTHTCFNNIVSASIYHSLFVEGIETAGGALTNAKYHLYLNYPQNPSNHTVQFSYWNNLMGDPSLVLWTEQPKQLNVDFDNVVTLGTKYINVHCYDDTRMPLKDVWVTIKSDDNNIFDTGYTNENGDILLNIENAPVGTIKLTATKRNYIPSLNEISIVSHYLNVAIAGYSLDDSNGNNNGQINPGENIALTLDIINNGSGQLNDLQATILSASDNITLINSNVQFNGILNPGETLSSSAPFEFSVNQNISGNEKIVLKIEIQSGDISEVDYLRLDVYAPLLIYDEYQLPGNSNSVLEPGETSELVVSIENVGTYDISDLSATLSTETSYIDIIDDSGYYPEIPVGQSIANINNNFTIEASVELVPGMQIPMILTLENNEGFYQEIIFNLSIGIQTLTDPLGPDSYGYFMYDDGDITYSSAPQYSWIELDPGMGGDGDILNLHDNDDDDSKITVIDLPIQLKFYGQTYTNLTVCSDGWVSPGTHEQASFMNWRLPGPLAPMPLIAPFWDDLKMDAVSKVLYKYFPDAGMVVIEWSNLRNDYDENYIETFEVILYDYSHSPTSTGDSNIVFQYNTINNVDQGEYGVFHVHHGQYATVGIQNQDGTVGLEYTFNNEYPTAAKPLQNEMAIAITGQPISYQNAYLTFAAVNILDNNNHNNQIDFGEDIQMYIQLNNIGHQAAQNVSATLSTNDSYITLENDSVTFPDINELSSAYSNQPFTFSVSSNIPDGHIITFSLNINSSDDSWSYIISQVAHAPNIQYSSFKILNDTNANGILEPGEMCDLLIKLNNSGGTPLNHIHATIFSSDENIIINDNSFDWPYIYGNREFGTIFKITAVADAPSQHSIPITLLLEAENGYTTAVDCLVFLGSTIEDFETGDFNLLPWQFAANPWIIDQENAISGNYSARSIDINDGQEASLYISMNVPDNSQISFYYKVSSETNYDFLRFYVDDNEIEHWSGEVPWTLVTFDIPSGNHIFKWSYTKDGSVSHGDDCAWIDYVQFPGSNGGEETPPELMFSRDSFEFTLLPDTVYTDTLFVTNIGSGIVSYTVSTENQQANFLFSDVVEGSVYTGHVNTIPFIINTIGLEYGDYQANIIVNDDRNITTIPIILSIQAVSNGNDIIPVKNKLYSAYPNPFNLSNTSKSSTLTIKYSIKKDTDVNLDIYNLKGQLVRSIVHNFQKAGTYIYHWDCKDNRKRNVSSGLYLYKLKTDGYQKIKKLVIIK